MAIDFGELTKRTVHIGIGGGNWIEVPMLTVQDYAAFTAEIEGLAKINQAADSTDGGRIEAVIRARNALAGLAKKVMPVEMHDAIDRMELPRVTRLVAVLCNGNDDSEGDRPEKKTTMPSQL